MAFLVSSEEDKQGSVEYTEDPMLSRTVSAGSEASAAEPAPVAFLYKLKEGVSPSSFGLNVARLAGAFLFFFRFRFSISYSQRGKHTHEKQRVYIARSIPSSLILSICGTSASHRNPVNGSPSGAGAVHNNAAESKSAAS